MGIFFIAIVISFFVLFFMNVLFVVLNLIFISTDGLQAYGLLEDRNFIDLISVSVFFKWIILGDVIWIIIALMFAVKRKHY